MKPLCLNAVTSLALPRRRSQREKKSLVQFFGGGAHSECLLPFMGELETYSSASWLATHEEQVSLYWIHWSVPQSAFHCKSTTSPQATKPVWPMHSILVIWYDTLGTKSRCSVFLIWCLNVSGLRKAEIIIILWINGGECNYWCWRSAEEINRPRSRRSEEKFMGRLTGIKYS